MTRSTKRAAAVYLATWGDICIPELQHGKRTCRKPLGFRKISLLNRSRSANDRRAAVAAVAYGSEPVQIASSARARILASRKVVDDIISRDAAVYGVNTGFGK